MSTLDPPGDLAWLLHRCGLRLQTDIDALAIKNGLSGGLRDYILLTVLTVEQPETQNELAQIVGLDKTTLMKALDRLETQGLIERKLNPNNRRTRTPVTTAKGRKLEKRITAKRLAVPVPGLSVDELEMLRGLLTSLDAACEDAGMEMSGSCV